MALASLLIACSGFETEDTPHGGEVPGPGVAGDEDLCPDPDNPRVHYQEQDPGECKGLSLECDESQNGFDNACGCGCIDKGDPLCPNIDDTSITWLSRDIEDCSETAPACPPGSIGFTNSCGCGCIER